MKLWSEHEPTHMGVTGLEEEDLQADLAHTSELVSRLIHARRAEASSNVRCLSVCSGIGREAVGGLIPGGCTTIDLLEAQPHMIEVAKKSISAQFLGEAYNENAEDHDFNQGLGSKYDVVFIGWCVQHIPDKSLITFLSRASAAVNHNGVVIVKDNVSDFADAVYNDDHHFVIRSAAYINALFHQANKGFERLFVEPVPQWPGNMFPYKALVWVDKDELAGWRDALGILPEENDL